MSPLGYLACFALGAAVAGGLYWLISRALYRGSWPWLDSIGESAVKAMAIGCAILAIAWIAVFATFVVTRLP